MATGELGDYELRKRSWSGHGKIEVPYDVVDAITKVVRGNVPYVQGGICLLRDQARILRLVVTRIVGEAAMETETILRIEFRCKDGD